MKISVKDVFSVFNGVAQLNQLSPQLSQKLTANFAILRPEARKFYEIEADVREAILDAEITLPLAEITEEDLPDNIPADMYEIFNPIGKENFKNKPTQIEQLAEAV